MNYKSKIIESAKKSISTQGKSIIKLTNYIDSEFAEIVEKIYKNGNGRVIITGIGKSANIANKIVATLNSTGTASIFMHAADAIHGDLGIVQKQDIVICISKSGNTPEIKVLVPILKNMGNVLIGMVGNLDSYLAKRANYILNTSIEKEVCSNNLAPTTSTTAQLVMGDALAICLQNMRGFSSEDFAKYHPGGMLGKKLYLRIEDIIGNNQKPKVNKDDNLHDIILEITSKRLGVTAVMDNNNIIGVITDGDLRRMLQTCNNISNIKATEIMNNNPICVTKNILAAEALEIMETKRITQLLVLDKDKYIGVIHLHDIIKEGIT